MLRSQTSPFDYLPCRVCKSARNSRFWCSLVVFEGALPTTHVHLSLTQTHWFTHLGGVCPYSKLTVLHTGRVQDSCDRVFSVCQYSKIHYFTDQGGCKIATVFTGCLYSKLTVYRPRRVQIVRACAQKDSLFCYARYNRLHQLSVVPLSTQSQRTQ